MRPDLEFAVYKVQNLTDMGTYSHEAENWKKKPKGVLSPLAMNQPTRSRFYCMLACSVSLTVQVLACGDSSSVFGKYIAS